MTTARDQLRHLFELGVAAADPYAAVLAHAQNIGAPAYIIAVGKAARQMAKAALSVVPGTPTLVVTNAENAQPLAGARVMAAGHPVPDDQGAIAAGILLDDLAQVNGPVLALISGGGSALLPAPVAGVTLADKAALNTLLLASGLDIVQMNLIRQQVSRIKGGGLLRAAAPHPVTALILSDVMGDNLAAIASGPTVAPLGTATQARALLRTAAIWRQVPPSIRAALANNTDPPPVLPKAANILVGSNVKSVMAMAAQASSAKVLPTPVEGDVRTAAVAICAASEPGLTLWGGETTVQLQGLSTGTGTGTGSSTGIGKGGRNQELALHIAIEAKARGWTNWTCLQAGTDGRDGPTDAAGGLVDQGTLARIAVAGIDLEAALANHDSYHILRAAGDLLQTGATGTNVADLGLLWRSKAHPTR